MPTDLGAGCALGAGDGVLVRILFHPLDGSNILLWPTSQSLCSAAQFY